jgi:predicted O-methyltransferase YrrM
MKTIKMTPPPIDWGGLPRRFMNPGELETLCALIGSVNPRVVVEFGVNTGRTAKAILANVMGIEHYVGIDVTPGYVTAKQVQRGEVPLDAGHMVKGDPRVELIVTAQGSHGMQPDELPMADAIFIDGDHSRFGVENDTMLADRIVRPGGIIIWHDYHTLGTVDVKEVLDEMVAKGRPIVHAEGTWIAFQRF